MHHELVPAIDPHRRLNLLLGAVMVIGITVAAGAGHGMDSTVQVTAAAIIEFVFGTFFIGDDRWITLIACGLGAAVLFNSTVTRGALR